MNSPIRLSRLATLTLLGLALAFQGCGKSDKKEAAKGDAAAPAGATAPAAPSGPVSGAAERDAIPFHNNLIAYIGTSQKPFKPISETAKKSQEFFDSESRKPTWGQVISGNSDYKKIATSKFAAPASFPAADKDFFNARIKIVREGVARLTALIGELDTYYTEESYRDDWHRKYLLSEIELSALIDKIATANDEMFERSDAITEDIDRRNLAKTPLGVYILNMRYVLDKAKAQAGLLLSPELRDTRVGVGVSAEEKAEMLAHAKPIAEKADALLKELDGMTEKFKAADRAPIKGKAFDGIYADFFKRYTAQRPELVRIIRELRENGYYNDQTTVQGGVRALLQEHNRFVDTANKH
jgi:hypothetical protein